ncbi:MAG: hypothetical protein WA322_06915, partial [Pseudolabrys sp.]
IINIVCELTSLFIDSGWVAQTLVGVIVLAAIVSEATPDLLATALALLLGFGIIVIDVASAARR